MNQIPDQKSLTLIEKRLELLRRSDAYRDLMSLITTSCNVTVNTSEILQQVADSVLRQIAWDITNCSKDSNIVILHLGVIAKE